MAEKKDEKKKKNTAKKSTKVSNAKKSTTSKNTVKKEIKKAVKEEVTKLDTYKEKLKKDKKKNKFVRWFNNLTLEQIIVGGFVILAILLIVLIGVSTKNTKTKNGDDIVVKIKGKTITANDLYKELKKKYGEKVAIDLIDDYILDKEYKTTNKMVKQAENTIETYKKNYGDNYKQFLEYNGIKNDAHLKELLIKNSKLSLVTDDYIKENITDNEMKKYYDEKVVGDIRAKHILISTETKEDETEAEKETKDKEAKKKAEEIIKKLKDGEDFDKLAKEYSSDEGTKKNGGDLGYFNTGEMEEAFENAAYKLKVNEYTTSPVKTSYGYHIIMKTGEKKKASYKLSKTSIKEKLVEQKKNEDETISVKAIIALRQKYNMNIKDKTVKKDYNDYIKTATTTTTTTTAKSN